MRKLWFVVVVVALGLSSLAKAQDRPWETDAALFDKVLAAANSEGIEAVEPYVEAIEEGLSAAPSLFAEPISDGGHTLVLVESSAENLFVLTKAASDGTGDVATVFNPYPPLALYLGVYYVEVGRYADGLRVIDAGLALSPAPDEMLGETVPELLSERGVALGRLQRMDEALATYEKGLQISQMDDAMRAVFHRGRGFVLIEMNRLDEAETAYKTSLELDPGNPIATKELAYIESLRAGGQVQEPTLTIPGDKGKKGKLG